MNYSIEKELFFIYIIFIYYAVCVLIFMTPAWCGCWFVVYIRRFIYQFFNVCPFNVTAVAGNGTVGP